MDHRLKDRANPHVTLSQIDQRVESQADELFLSLRCVVGRELGRDNSRPACELHAAKLR